MTAASTGTARARGRVRDRHRFVASGAELRTIRRRQLDLCAWRRSMDPGFAAWLDELLPGAPAVDERLALADVPAERWLSPLPASPWRQALAEDVRALAALYARVAQVTEGRVQLGWVSQQQCPRFHTDYVKLRLICTYVGPGTEWIAEAGLDREAAERCAAHEAPLRPGHQVQHLERFTVAFMKGRAFDGNARHGLVHRSPPVGQRPRLVLVINDVR
jgi:hypothetical protein